MGKSSPPPAPTPPSPAAISEANVDTAFATAQLQRAMQFGSEVMKDGYVREKLDVPEGAKPVYSSQDIRTTMPEFIMDEKKGRPRLKVGSDGKIESQWIGNDNPSQFAKEGDYVGMDWWEAVEKQNKADPPNAWTHKHGDAGEQYGTTQVETLTGYESGDGKFTSANRYFKIDDKGNRTEVKRGEALQADFTGMSDVDLARKQWEFEKETSPERTKFFLDQLEENYPRMTKLANEILESTDPTGFKAREMLGKLAMEYKPSELAALPQMQEIEDAAASGRLGDTGSELLNAFFKLVGSSQRIGN